MKVFTHCLLTRIRRTLDEAQPVEQAGFRRKFSTLDHIITCCRLIEAAREYQESLVLTFVDYKKAFDSVEPAKVWKALEEQGVESRYIKRGKWGLLPYLGGCRIPLAGLRLTLAGTGQPPNRDMVHRAERMLGYHKAQLTKAENALRKKIADVDPTIMERVILTRNPGMDMEAILDRKQCLIISASTIDHAVSFLKSR
ncbi:hypothetical protein ANCCAN_08316 [Ancylostoma caninum]|uniref:Uncharacterized protein n=1 Tax=Ancylostoma caninum TaxID=29170 RepID=A0A368GQU1_ANCCA|nr:hypothetical protein ANCCAN_08316 [Ancylostoma caninum]